MHAIFFNQEQSGIETAAAKDNVLGSSDICDRPQLTTADGWGHHDGIYLTTLQVQAPLFLTAAAEIQKWH